MEIRILTQEDTSIVAVTEIREIKLQDKGYMLQGIGKDNNLINLGKYSKPHYSNIVFLYIMKNFNEDPNKIIRLPEDDAEIENLDY